MGRHETVSHVAVWLIGKTMGVDVWVRRTHVPLLIIRVPVTKYRTETPCSSHSINNILWKGIRCRYMRYVHRVEGIWWAMVALV